MNRRGISAVIGHGACVFAFLCCACGSSQNPGVTNTQAPYNGQPYNTQAPYNAQPQPQYPNSNKPSACLERGSACVSSNDCCTEWCVNGFCALKQP